MLKDFHWFFLNYLSFKVGMVHYFKKLYLRMLFSKFGLNYPRGSEEGVENLKRLRTDRRKDRRRTKRDLSASLRLKL